MTYCVVLLLLLHQHTEVPAGSVEDDVDVDKDSTAEGEEAGLDQEHSPGEGVQGVVVDTCEEGG